MKSKLQILTLIAATAACSHTKPVAQPAPAAPPPASQPPAMATSQVPPRRVLTAAEEVPRYKNGPLITWGPLPEGTPHGERSHPYDLFHQVIQVRFDWKRHAVIGSTTLSIAPTGAPLTQASFDAVDMTFSNVSDNHGHKLAHTYANGSITVRFPQPVTDSIRVVLNYSTIDRPRSGVYFIDRVHYLWTQGETEANRFWVPTYDYPNDKTTWEMLITTDANEKALSNGKLLGTRKVANGVEWHWMQDKPASTYLMSVSTGPYVVVQDHWEDIPVDYWTYPDSVEAAKRGFGATPRAVGVYSKKTGIRYPWAKYDQSVAPDYIFGGMENVTATTQLDDGILHPAWAEPNANADGLTAHELGHQWYGDLLTTKTWAHIWLNEGFATLMEQIFREEDKGKDEGDWNRSDSHDQVIAADRAARRPLVYDRWVNDPFELFFSGHIYPKGATVMQMLRHQLGDSLFWASMHRYTADHMYNTVTTADLQKAFEQTTGRNFDSFFKQWVYGAGMPAYHVVWATGAKPELALQVDEVQPQDSLTGHFDADVDVQVLTDKGAVNGVVHMRNGRGILNLQLPAEAKAIIWDHDDWMLDVFDFPRPTTMLAYQLKHAQSAVDRGEAVKELSSRTSQEEAVAALADAGATDPFWAVRQRALAALAPVARDATAARALLDRAEHDPDARVRQTAVTGLAHAGASATEKIKAIAENDASLYVRGAAVVAFAMNDSIAALPTVRKMIAINSWQDVLRVASVTALNQIYMRETWDILLPYIRPGTLVNTRTSAITVLTNQAKGREAELARTLGPLLNDPFYQVRQSAASALGRLGQKSSLAALNARAKVEAESRVLGTIQQAIAAINAK